MYSRRQLFVQFFFFYFLLQKGKGSEKILNPPMPFIQMEFEFALFKFIQHNNKRLYVEIASFYFD